MLATSNNNSLVEFPINQSMLFARFLQREYEEDKMNYTKEQTEYMVTAYKANPSRETVVRLAEELNKSVKSIIGKLSREGVYRRTVYKTKLGEDPITKLEIVESIADLLGVSEERLLGLEKSPKAVLKTLESLITQS